MPDSDEQLRQRTQAHRHALDTIPHDDKPQFIPGKIPNTPLSSATIAFCLGSLFSLGFFTFLHGGFSPWWATYQLGFYVASWAAFHWGEFAVTAGWNFEKCSIDSYLLENGSVYHIAHATSLFEYLVSLYFFPAYKSSAYAAVVGIATVLIGQALRSTAMIHAATNFSHAVAFQKRDTHRLVSDGVYSWSRHPSYAAFVYWALGTQILLQNPLTFCMFCFVLYRFFSQRIKAEEGALVRFFGQEYLDYRKRVGTGIPFIP